MYQVIAGPRVQDNSHPRCSLSMAVYLFYFIIFLISYALYLSLFTLLKLYFCIISTSTLIYQLMRKRKVKLTRLFHRPVYLQTVGLCRGNFFLLCSGAGSSLADIRLRTGIEQEKEKLGFIHYHNRITVVNNAGISAATVAFGDNPSLFPLRADPCCLKKKKICPLFPLLWAFPDCNKGFNWHTQSCTRTHRAGFLHMFACAMHDCMCAPMAVRCPSIQQVAWPAHQEGLHLHNFNKTLSAPSSSLLRFPLLVLLLFLSLSHSPFFLTAPTFHSASHTSLSVGLLWYISSVPAFHLSWLWIMSLAPNVIESHRRAQAWVAVTDKHLCYLGISVCEGFPAHTELRDQQL